MKYPINLGMKMSDAMGPSMMATPESKEHFPTLHLEWEKEYPLPDSGTLTVKFNKTGETKSTHNGKTRHSLTLEIKSIESASEGDDDDEEDDEPKAKNESTGDRLDKMAKEATDQGAY